MFENEFYPTPYKLAAKMWEPYIDKVNHYKYSAILEPSAGKGDLLNPLTSNKRSNLYAFEKNAELRDILAKRATIIGHDFLEYYGGSLLFDLIVMNPPFSNGDEHLLHAWDVLARGDLCCLLNAETIRNPYTLRRKQVVDLIQSNGTVEFIQDALINAERKTNVEVAIVRLHKEQFIPELDYDVSDKVTGADSNNPFSTLPAIPGVNLEIADKLKSILRAYVEGRKAFAEYVKALDKINFFMEPLVYNPKEIIDGAYGYDKKSNFSRVNDFSINTCSLAWKKIIDEFAPPIYMTEYTTSQLKNFFNSHGTLDLTLENVLVVIGWIVKNSDKLMNGACADIFDRLTTHYFENRRNLAGWKTNNMWVVADKVIIPYVVERWSTKEFRVRYECKVVKDFFKILSWCNGDSISNEEMKNDALFGVDIYQNKCEANTWYESKYCDFKFFKKGTVHLLFKTIEQKKLLEEFNRRACAAKMWLGSGNSK